MESSRVQIGSRLRLRSLSGLRNCAPDAGIDARFVRVEMGWPGLAGALESLLDGFLGEVEKRDFKANVRKKGSDSAAHRSRPDDAHLAHVGPVIVIHLDGEYSNFFITATCFDCGDLAPLFLR